MVELNQAGEHEHHFATFIRDGPVASCARYFQRELIFSRLVVRIVKYKILRTLGEVNCILMKYSCPLIGRFMKSLTVATMAIARIKRVLADLKLYSLTKTLSAKLGEEILARECIRGAVQPLFVVWEDYMLMLVAGLDVVFRVVHRHSSSRRVDTEASERRHYTVRHGR